MLTKTLARLAIASLALVAATASAVTDESLGYQVVYRGAFSLGEDMPIADVRLASESPTVQGAPLQTSMVASSAAYAGVESLYPFRYRFRSWADAESGQLIGLEAYEKTRRVKHRLYLRDDSPTGMRRVDPAAADGSGPLARLLAGAASPEALPGPLFDRLGLLNAVRRQALSAGAWFDFPVTNGRDRMRYRVHVEKPTTVHLGGVEIACWKLRLDASEIDEHGQTVAAHRPVYVWLGRDARHTPLRVDIRHAIGLFRVQLSTPLQQTALREAGT